MFLRKKNNRRETRVEVNKPATLKLLTGVSDLQLDGMLVDLSSSGAGLRLRDFVMRGLAIEIEWSGGMVRGKVQYCRQLNSGGYKLGMRFD